MQQENFLINNDNKKKPLWEYLITDGHVIAARLRLLSPYIIGIGVILTVFGFYSILIEGNKYPLSLKENYIQKLNKLKPPILEKFSIINKQPSIEQDEIKNLPPLDELPKVVNVILDSLNSNKPYPEEISSAIKEVSVDDFWIEQWPTNIIISINKGDIKAFGAILQVGNMNYYSKKPVKWVGVFKKKSDKWLFVSIKSPYLITLSDQPSASPEDLLSSLKQLMDLR